MDDGYVLAGLHWHLIIEYPRTETRIADGEAERNKCENIELLEKNISSICYPMHNLLPPVTVSSSTVKKSKKKKHRCISSTWRGQCLDGFFLFFASSTHLETDSKLDTLSTRLCVQDLSHPMSALQLCSSTYILVHNLTNVTLLLKFLASNDLRGEKSTK